MKPLGALLNISGLFLIGLAIVALSGGSEGMKKVGMVVMAIGVLVFIINLPHLQNASKSNDKEE